MEQENFLRALFDTRFTTLITPKVIRVLYILAIIGIGIGAIFTVVAAFNESTGLGVLTLLVLAPLGFLLYVIIARLYLEIVIVLFKIHESARAIAQNTGGLPGGGQTPPPVAPDTPPAPVS